MRTSLLTKGEMASLPKLQATDNIPEKELQALVRFYIPQSTWTWYAAAFDGDNLFYGYIGGQMPRFGFFALSDLAERLCSFEGIGVQRDWNFKPTTMKNILNVEGAVV